MQMILHNVFNPNSVELPSERTRDSDAHFGDMNYERFATAGVLCIIFLVFLLIFKL